MIVYEVFVRSFRDLNGDGIGDLRGILDSLDYLEDLGADVLWLTPIFPSPSYHGYDVTDYFNVNPLYGSLDYFKEFMENVHERGFKLILDLPLNHTSSLHRWFLERPEYYIWADDKTDINQRRGWDGAFVWHPSDRGYYYGLFGSCMPDLNYSNPEVVERALEIVRFWTAMGVDGFRFDAAKHIYDDHDKNIEFWRKVSYEIRSMNTDAILVAEVWDSPDVNLEYSRILGYTFNFHVFGSLKKSVIESNPWSLKSALEETQDLLVYSFNFISNHDVNRIASDIPDERRRLMAFSLLLSLPGVPVLYYGDELGLPGVYDPSFPEDVVEPFPWYETLCGVGQTRWKSVRFSKPFHGFSVEYQSAHENSFLKKVKELLSFRKENEWIEKARLEDLKIEGSKLSYRLAGKEELDFVHDFLNLTTIVNGMSLIR